MSSKYLQGLEGLCPAFPGLGGKGLPKSTCLWSHGCEEDIFSQAHVFKWITEEENGRHTWLVTKLLSKAAPRSQRIPYVPQLHQRGTKENLISQHCKTKTIFKPSFQRRYFFLHFQKGYFYVSIILIITIIKVLSMCTFGSHAGQINMVTSILFSTLCFEISTKTLSIF